MSFFGSFWGTCCGTDVFDRLRKFFFLKVLLHLLLMLFFCALFIGIGQYLLQGKRWQNAENLFCQQFGMEINCKEGVWEPTLNPDKSSFLQLPFSSLLLYATPQGLKIPEQEYLAQHQYIVLWGHGCFAISVRDSGERWRFLQFFPDGNSIKSVSTPKLLSTADVWRQLESAAKLPAKKWPDNNLKTMSSHSIFKLIHLCNAVGQGIGYILLYFAMLIFDLLLFSVAYMLFHWGTNKTFTFGELWNIGIYAAFPVMAVVSLLPALQLPLEKFSQHIFMFVWLLYFLVILHSLKKKSA